MGIVLKGILVAIISPKKEVYPGQNIYINSEQQQRFLLHTFQIISMNKLKTRLSRKAKEVFRSPNSSSSLVVPDSTSNEVCFPNFQRK